jgi:ATP-binding cassette subfamily B protein
VLTIFREKLIYVFDQVPDFIGYMGRTDIAMKYFDHINVHLDDVLNKDKLNASEIPFQKVNFENVYYRYKNGKYIFQDANYELNLDNNKIIGITGPSGAGKSTFVKLMSRMYPCERGRIFIDNVDIQNIDPLYLRKNITYVNQTSKLFDRKVIKNMLYGCNDEKKCLYFLKKIMDYPNISKLYGSMDIEKKDSGLLGENLSGGQRQVVNMIGGLINPSKILILDEPTNALDPELKKEVIEMIKDFKHYKKCILIITHDKDVMNIFDKQMRI